MKKRGVKINWWIVAAWAVAAEAIGAASQLFAGDVKGYYLSLNLPPLAPAPAVFGIAWGILYLLLGGAAGYVYQLAPASEQLQKKRRVAQVVYWLQLLLNFCWSIVFFGWHSDAGAIVIVLMLVALNVYQWWLYRSLDKRAAWALVPYVAWLAFASYLTIGVALRR
ncbi:tryptophan-rich sensory protein [bacterium]|nr:tryptophan-rich sensory protein [bacterium]